MVSYYKYLFIALVLIVTSDLMALKENIHGFAEMAYGKRTVSDDFQEKNSLNEIRLQLDYSTYLGSTDLKLKADFIHDDITNSTDIDLETGKGWIDLRDANINFFPNDMMDIKIGRQILTWGTGDLIFINDLFPKDWQSFFNGRNEEYLKAPSDAVKFSFFTEYFNFDLVYTPQFDQDRFISGERLSYFSPMINDFAGNNAVITPRNPDEYFSDREIAVRLYKNFNALETALYAYQGFWKTPEGYDTINNEFFYPEMNAYGFSMRTNFLKGLINFEIGYYDSREDKKGTNPYIRNSELRFLIAYEQEIMKELNLSCQFYQESMQNYSKYKDSYFNKELLKGENRQLITIRLTKMAFKQNLTASFFGFYSPTDKDFHMRPSVSYKFSDNLSGVVGGNIFNGDDDHTFFAQFQNNSNVYFRVRYGF